MLERTDAITNDVLEPVTFVLAYPTVCQIPFPNVHTSRTAALFLRQTLQTAPQQISYIFRMNSMQGSRHVDGALPVGPLLFLGFRAQGLLKQDSTQ